jgi:hypothetical protein
MATTVQPRSARIASVFYGIATAGGTLGYQKFAPTREAADKLLNERLAAPFHWMPTTSPDQIAYTAMRGWLRPVPIQLKLR